MTTDNTQHRVEIKVGTLADGSIAIARATSADGVPRLEIYNITDHTAKIIKYTGEKGSIKPFPQFPPDAQDQWIPWSPLNDIQGKYHLNAISYQNSILEITLEISLDGNTSRLIIQFAQDIIAYTCSPDLFRSRTINELEIVYGTAFYGRSTFFKVINSSYIDMIKLTSAMTDDATNLHHFVLITADNVIDVVASYEPNIQHIGKKLYA
jgi:hypothetical protein